MKEKLLFYPVVDIVVHQGHTVSRAHAGWHDGCDFRLVELVVIDLRYNFVLLFVTGGKKDEGAKYEKDELLTHDVISKWF